MTEQDHSETASGGGIVIGTQKMLLAVAATASGAALVLQLHADPGVTIGFREVLLAVGTVALSVTLFLRLRGSQGAR